MSDKKKIAAVISSYYPRSHADVLLGKFLAGWPTDDGVLPPRVQVASIFLDQRHPQDMCYGLAEKHGVAMHESIMSALCLGGKELAVDGVLIVAEHGDYPWNEKEQHLYPRKYFFEQVCGVFASSKRCVPTFNDKHLSYNWPDAKWMADRARQLKVPFMAGSSIPYTWRSPWVEFDKGVRFEQVVAVGYGGSESYGFHMIEGLQCMVERRAGGETGVKAVQCLEGNEVWKAAADGLWSQEIAQAACNQMENLKPGKMEDLCKNPVLFLVEYKDGLKAAAVMLNGYAPGFGFGARVGGQTVAFEYYLKYGEPWTHFSYMGLNIEEMFVTGKPVMGFERTLLTTGILAAGMDSRYEGHRKVETPHLAICYISYDQIPFLPRKTRPIGASLG